MRNNNIPSKNNGNSNKSTDKNKHAEKPIHYFNKVIKNMDNKEFSKLKVIYKTEISMEFCDFDEQLIKQHTKNDEMEKYFNNSDSLFWIEFLENEILYSALKELRLQDLIILNMWINQKFTQKEIANIMSMEEKTINKRLIRLRNDLRKRLDKK